MSARSRWRFVRWTLRVLEADEDPKPRYWMQCAVNGCAERSEDASSAEGPERWALEHAARLVAGQQQHHTTFQAIVAAPVVARAEGAR